MYNKFDDLPKQEKHLIRTEEEKSCKTKKRKTFFTLLDY